MTPGLHDHFVVWCADENKFILILFEAEAIVRFRSAQRPPILLRLRQMLVFELETEAIV